MIKLKRSIKRKFELGKTIFEYGLFLEKQERTEESKDMLEDAYNIFKDIGAKMYEKKVADLLGIFEIK